MPRSHLLYMLIFALLTSAFFALFWKDEKRDIIKLFFKILGYMILGGIATAWLMHIVPFR